MNAAGYTLMGYPVNHERHRLHAQRLSGLQPVNLRASLLSATPTTKGDLTANLNKEATAVLSTDLTPGKLTSSNTAASNPAVKFTSSSSVVTYDNTGKAITLDVYYTKTDNNKWEVAVYNHADASPTTGTNPSTSSPFPYAGTGTASKGPLYTAALEFDATSGKSPRSRRAPARATTVDTVARNGVMSIDLRSTNANAVTALNGSQIALNISDFTQYSKDYSCAGGDGERQSGRGRGQGDGQQGRHGCRNFTSGTSRNLFRCRWPWWRRPTI